MRLWTVRAGGLYIAGMIPIEKLLSHLERAVSAIGPELSEARSILSDPFRLTSVFLQGEERRLAAQQRTGGPVPRFCIFSVTWECNLECAGCYARDYVPRQTLSLAQIERIAAEACDLGSFIFVIVGGEPLMVRGLIETLGRLTDALFLLFTNGTLLEDDHAETLASMGNILPVISTEPDEHLTKQRRGQAVARKVAQAMQRLRRARVPFAFASMVTHQNLRHVTGREWFDQMWRAGARFGFLLDYVPVGRNAPESLLLTEEDRACKTDVIERRFEEGRPVVMNFPPDEYAAGPCQAAGRGMIHINADGFVEPCPFSHFAADNVLDKPLEEILGSPFFRALQDELLDAPNPRGECLLAAHESDVRAIAARTCAEATD